MKLARAPRVAAALLVPSVVLSACSKSARVESRVVTLHAPAACAPGASAFGVFYPFGDFQPPSPPQLPVANVGEQLAGAPEDTHEIEVDVTDTTEWRAHAFIAGAGDVDALLLPYQSPCALTDPVSARAGAAVGAIDATHVLVAGGGASGTVPATVLVDLSVGTVRPLPAGLLVPRAQASVTSWSGGAVVAGGVRPDTSETLASAEVFASSAGDFDGQVVTLSEARTRHGAATLVNGETLLVGGVGATGTVLASMEIVDAASHRARTTSLASLAVPRADPTVLVLASGEVLVAGGVNASGAPVGTLEWLASDASAASRSPQQLVASSHQAFTRLGAGGALAVIAPDVPTPGFSNVWVISADGGLQAATSIEGTLTAPRLFDGADQAPLLWTGDRWLVWQPWPGAFGLPTAIGSTGPAGDPIASPEPGLALWLDGTAVRALRFATRGPYASTASPFLLADTSFTAPDRLVTGPTGPIAFDPNAGLSLQPGASVFVTDATFGAFTLDAQTPGGLAPALVLRDTTGVETVLDATACPIPAASAIHFERDGATVRASAAGGSLVPCTIAPAAGARVAIGVRGQGSVASVVRDVAIARH